MKPIVGVHYVGGVEAKPWNGGFVQAQLFYKDLSDLIVRGKSIKDPLYTNNGRGRVYGADLLFQQEMWKGLYGWIAYTVSRSERKEDAKDPWRVFRLDQTHIFTLIASYKLPKGYQVGLRFRVVTGNPVTPVRGAYFANNDGDYSPIHGDTYSARLATFHQLDLRFDKAWTFNRWKLSVYLDIQNLYYAKNPEGVGVQLRLLAEPADHRHPFSAGLRPASGLLMRKRLLPIVGLCLALGAPGCDSFKPATLVEQLRVLAIRAEPAEIASGETTTLHALVVDLDPDAKGRPVTLEWALCDKAPAPGVEIDTDCYDLDTAPFITQLETLPDQGAQATMPPHTITSLGIPDTTGGLYVPIRLRVRAGTNTMVTAFHKLRLSNGLVPPNHNPSLADLAFIPTGEDGELPDLGQTVPPQPLPDDSQPPMELPLGGKLRFRASAQPGSAESYTTIAGSIGATTDPSQIETKTVTELIRFFWYASAGKIGTEVTGEERPDTQLDTSEYTDSLGPRGGLVDLWLVAREDRGGIDYLHRRIHLQ